MKQYSLVFDLYKPTNNIVPQFTQYDTGGVLNITIVDGNEPVDLQGCRVVAKFVKPSKKPTEAQAIIVPNQLGKISVELPDQTCTEVGDITAMIDIYDKDAHKTSLYKFKLSVIEYLTDNGIDSEAQFPILFQIISDLNRIEETLSDHLLNHPEGEGNVDLSEYATVSYVDLAVQEIALTPGPQGPKGEQGIQGPQGPKGDSGDQLYPLNKQHIVVNALGGFSEGDNIAGLKLSDIIEKLLCIAPPVPEAPSFLGLIDFKEISTITFADLIESGISQGIVVKPNTTYTHSSGSAFNKSCVIAFPKEFGRITGVYDGANISLTGSYHWADIDLDVPGRGLTPYVLGCSQNKLAYTNGTVVRWAIE